MHETAANLEFINQNPATVTDGPIRPEQLCFPSPNTTSVLPESVWAISLDIDWAPDQLVDYSLELLEQYNLDATIFTTHKLAGGVNGHEIGLHPNFNKLDTIGREISNLKDIYPEAKGLRSHSLVFSSRHAEIYGKFGITYDSNYYLPSQDNIKPFLYHRNVLEIPFMFMDDAYSAGQGRKPGFTLADLSLDEPGCKVFVFHPIHIFLNTDSPARYLSAKKYYHQPRQLENFVNPGAGIRTLFIELLEHVSARRIKTNTLGEIDTLFRLDHGN